MLRHFLWDQLHPESDMPSAHIPLNNYPLSSGRIQVFHSAIDWYYAPSDLCGTGGMCSERICSNPHWRREHPRYDTVFVVTNAEHPGMLGMTIGRVLLLFSFKCLGKTFPCALVHWLVPIGEHVDNDTGMWVVRPEFEGNGQRRTTAIIHLDTLARSAHLLPVYGSSSLPEDHHFSESLDAFRSYYVNCYVDHHAHEFLAM